jgi:exonuclease V gamma subunit
MLNLCYANQMEALIEPLFRRVDQCQQTDPLHPITIIIPNPSVSHFVRFQVAQRLGVCANLDFKYLRHFLTDQIEHSKSNIKILETESLQLLIFKHLNTPDVLQHISLEPVRTYLDVAESLEERQGRCIQLAGQLAHLFEEYAYSRPHMLQKWKKGEITLQEDQEGSWARSERWQRIIWRGLFYDDGSVILDEPHHSRNKRSKSKEQIPLFHQNTPNPIRKHDGCFFLMPLKQRLNLCNFPVKFIFLGYLMLPLPLQPSFQLLVPILKFMCMP